MADLAHDASGPASSEPAGTAQQASGPASSDKGKLRVFISYSREDLDFADQLAAALDFSGFECLIDREGISGGEDWKRRLGNLISEADTVVFVLSPSSARSEICDWEVEEAARLNKRILPANCRPLEGVSPPPRLRDLNYIFFYKEPKVPGSGFGTGLASLVAALNTDFDWLREHTRYLQRAMEWDKGGRPANRLLSGNDILDAKAWAARRPKGAPEPTALHLDFIRASEERGGGATERAAQAARSDGRSTSRARDGPARPRRGAQATCEGCEGQEYCAGGREHLARSNGSHANHHWECTGSDGFQNQNKRCLRWLRLRRDTAMRLRCSSLAGLMTWVLAWRRTTPRHVSGSRRPPTRATREPCTTSACFTQTVTAWRRTTPRRVSGSRRPPTRATRAP